MEPIITDLPFKVSETTIVVIKALPVLQCRNCSEYLIEDTVMAAAERILASRDDAAELEVIRFAA
jgi:YgiT-type zinc finger domain-containing protein